MDIRCGWGPIIILVLAVACTENEPAPLLLTFVPAPPDSPLFAAAVAATPTSKPPVVDAVVGSSPGACAVQTGDPVLVFVTPHGATYHLPGCRYGKKGEPMGMDEAIALGKRPCKVCKPPGGP